MCFVYTLLYQVFFISVFHVCVYFAYVILNTVCVYVTVFTVDLKEASNKPVPRKPLVLFVPRGKYTYSYLCRLSPSALAIVTKAQGMNVNFLIPSKILKMYSLTLFGYEI